jgi:UDP-N-acetylmuramoyl-tripeptide--D-alanyl-D-alanine ligase
MNIADIHARFLQCTTLSIDTRRIDQGSFFVALKGERFDANTFAAEALEKGASFVIVDDSQYVIDSRTILVKNSLTTLQQLSQYHRNYLKLPIIALTGSNGKTTTKELIHAVLSKQYRTKATVGNLNNHIGVPLTLLSFTKDTEIGIVEMGANHQQEIAFLCAIATPDYGYITNFGKAHLEGFGGYEGVIKGKSEMYDYLAANDKSVFVNLDDSIQSERTQQMSRVTFGSSDGANLVVRHVSAKPFVHVCYDNFDIQSKLVGIYNASNITAAAAIGKHFEVSESDIKSALENYVPANNRSQLISKNGIEIILDAYNANPSSMSAALAHFTANDGKKKVAILGDMFELGSESIAEHQAIVQLMIQHRETETWFVGKDFFACTTDDAHLHFYKDYESFATAFTLGPAKNILIKGSRGMALERCLELI